LRTAEEVAADAVAGGRTALIEEVLVVLGHRPPLKQ
jgi:hypothetical protein